ncbi:class I SAM-dependent methyltransferase [Anabaena lutea]|uniref:Methyltransferase domain-containing protein n=1 Tax=Anabaena lutea FACHB-196 TaxID=2692881 RepID=A0ABR8FK85_9NOST|nr:methyltransferase domain-containing protein [Anabaena lutea]MBD2570586.1 methyltransferase domain-containing protein [Anabaena lutea FACHB-196]
MKSKLRLGYLYLKLQQLRGSLNVSSEKIKRQFSRPTLPVDNKEINLHLGCGNIAHPKFINIDGRPAPHIHYVRAIDNLAPFKDNSVDLIYACHCLEHFSYNRVPLVISEWHRVLKDNGILRISVPDFDLLIKIYNDCDQNLDSIIGLLMGGQDYQFNFHKAAFNEASLRRLLLNAGFNEVRSWQPGSTELMTFNDWSGRLLGGKYPVSLNLEAIKNSSS